MRDEKEAENLLKLIEYFAPELGARSVPLSFSGLKGFGVRIQPMGQVVSFLYFHNGREWFTLREDGVMAPTGMGWKPKEIEMAMVAILLLTGQLASNFKLVQRLPGLEEEGKGKESTFTACQAALGRLSTHPNSSVKLQKWASEALSELLLAIRVMD